MSDEEGFGGSGFGGGGFGGQTPSPQTSSTPNPPAPSNPATPSPPATQTKPTSYGDKKVIPAKKVTDLPEAFLKIVSEAAKDLPQELRSLGIIGATLTKFEGIEPCPPCHSYIPPKNLDDENDTGECVYLCEDDEVCNGVECVKDDERDPPCKDTMRFSVDNDGDRMCRVEAFNVVNAKDTSDDGFSWEIDGQRGKQYSYVVLDRNQPTNVGLTPIPTQEEDDSADMVQNYTAGSAQPRPRLFKGHLAKGVGYRIPSVSAESQPVKVMVSGSDSQMKKPTNFNFYRDSADNLYLECPELNVGQSYDGTFIVQIQYKMLQAPKSTYDINNLMSEKMTFADLRSKAQSNAGFLPSMPPMDAVANQSADFILNAKGYSMDSPIGEVMKDAVSWLNKMVCEGIPKMRGDVLPVQMYMNTNAGACRHRAFLAFLMFNRLGLPTRFCTSTCHAWPEFFDYDNRIWVQVDLGGCGGTEPAPCGACTRPNPLYGVEPNEPECLPVECAENYYCDARYGKCIPDCDALYPDGNYHYNPKTDRCEECEEGRTWNPILEICECEVCPDGFSMIGGRCVDEDGNESEEAPLGFYTDLITDLCLPIPDCEKDRPGTIFDETTGTCECPMGPNPRDLEAPLIPYRWDEVQGECVPNVQKMCPEGQWWDEAMGRCRDIPERPVDRIITPTPEEPEVLEDVIVVEGQVRKALTGWLNPATGETVDIVEMANAGQTEESLAKKGYTVQWQPVQVTKGGKSTVSVSSTLKGMSEWISKHDLPDGIEVLAGWSRSNPVNRLIYKASDSMTDFKDWADSWQAAFAKSFPDGRFSVSVSSNRMEVKDSLA